MFEDCTTVLGKFCAETDENKYIKNIYAEYDINKTKSR